MLQRYFFILWLCTISIVGNAKCDAKKIVGRWIGEYEFTETGAIFHMELAVTEADRCTFSGTVYWPEYFSAKVAIVGEQEKGRILSSRDRTATRS